MDKNRFPGFAAGTHGWLAVALMLAILVTMLTTRAGLSISIPVAGAFALWGHSLKRWVDNRWWLAGVAWVAMYGMSYFWSDDAAQWGRAFSVKLPILLLPLAAGLLPVLNRKLLRALVAGILLLLLAGVGYSLMNFLADPQTVIAGYGVSHVLRTPLFNSHIHFSAAVAAGVVVGIMGYPLTRPGLGRIALIFILAVFAVYLHLLASKTGLLMLYLFAVLAAARAVSRGRVLRGVGIFAGGAALVWLCLVSIPTLRARVGYVVYTWEQASEGRRDGLYSDLGRALSWRVATAVAKDHPLAGAGAGDILPAMREEYARMYPDVAPENQLVPHNQPLCVAVAAGLPALLLFMIWLFLPLSWRRREGGGFYTKALWAMLLVPLAVEPFLEVQAGVAVYLYFLLIAQFLQRSMHAGAVDDNPAAAATGSSRE